jgi:hypothetical protein
MATEDIATIAPRSSAAGGGAGTLAVGARQQEQVIRARGEQRCANQRVSRSVEHEFRILNSRLRIRNVHLT